MNVWVHETAKLIGRVSIGNFSSVLPYAVLRGDISSISVGNYTNIQDHCIAHSDFGYYVKLGHFVTVGHSAILHGCTVEDCCIVGMKAVLMNGSKIGRGSIVGVGTVVKEGAIIPPGSLVVGNPAIIKENRYESFAGMIENALIYYFLTRFHKEKTIPDERTVEKIYCMSKSFAADLDEKIKRGATVETLANEEYFLS
ncbi:MAG: gamma carbonic anhydrase family protein [Spirochaetes bacterium]|nr:gamma carbonic anhydrase family protein [Spirochaetota bacterium]